MRYNIYLVNGLGKKTLVETVVADRFEAWGPLIEFYNDHKYLLKKNVTELVAKLRHTGNYLVVKE